MNDADLKNRTKQFALRTIKRVEALPRSIGADVLGRPVVRSATSVAANCRDACRAKPRADFVSKTGTVEEEADATGFWLELLVGAGLLPEKSVAALAREADELTAIAVSSIRTARSGLRNPQSAVRNPQST